MGSRWAVFKNNEQWEPISLFVKIEEVNGYAPNLYGILNSPNPGLSYLPQQITINGIWKRGRYFGGDVK